jgi:Protein of unknown function (DUF2569)
MYCGKCGREAKIDTRFCAECGTELEAHQEIAVPAYASDTIAQVTQFSFPDSSTSTSAKNLSGIGGWLYLFCIRNAVLAPIFNTSALLSSNDILDKVIFLLLVSVELIAGVLVWRVSPKAFRFLYIYFGFLILFGLTSLIIGAIPPQDTLGSQSLIRLGVEEILWSVIWFSYFHSSKRVRATFGKIM